MHYIYTIKNKINNKIYIGQTIDLQKRWYKHQSVSRDQNYNYPLYNSMRKYGIENFEIEIIDQCDDIFECNNLEELWIERRQSRNKDIGYNISKGGDNKEISEETRQKMSLAMAGEKNPFYGKKHSEETKRKIAEARRGTKTSEEVKQKMSETRKGEGNGMYGKNHTQESKDKIAKGREGKYEGENSPMFGRKKSEETIKKTVETRKRNKKIKEFEKELEKIQNEE
jgi:hypothetical protein